MQYRKMGRTGIDVSVLGFGCMRLPTLGAADKIDEPSSTKMLHDAIEKGINYVDTAWFYHAPVFGQAGQSEPFVGRALSGGWRDRVQLATKLPQQLERLQTDHIDFYLVHGLDGDSWNRMRDLGVREFLDSARARGLIRFPAFSFHGNQNDFPRIIDEYDQWAFGQLQYNYMDTEWALRYVWNEPGVTTLLSGMNSSSQLEENLGIADAAQSGRGRRLTAVPAGTASPARAGWKFPNCSPRSMLLRCAHSISRSVSC